VDLVHLATPLRPAASTARPDPPSCLGEDLACIAFAVANEGLRQVEEDEIRTVHLRAVERVGGMAPAQTSPARSPSASG